jgi:hypothetical protein
MDSAQPFWPLSLLLAGKNGNRTPAAAEVLRNQIVLLLDPLVPRFLSRRESITSVDRNLPRVFDLTPTRANLKILTRRLIIFTRLVQDLAICHISTSLHPKISTRKLVRKW